MILTASYTQIKSIKYTPIMSKNPLQSYIKSIRNNNLLHCNVKIKHNNNKSHTETLSELEKAIINAKTICAVETHQDCKVAWDIVEELSAAAANKKQKLITDFNDIYLDLEPSFEDSDIFDI